MIQQPQDYKYTVLDTCIMIRNYKLGTPHTIPWFWDQFLIYFEFTFLCYISGSSMTKKITVVQKFFLFNSKTKLEMQVTGCSKQYSKCYSKKNIINIKQ